MQSEFHDFFTGLRNFWHRVAVSPPPFILDRVSHYVVLDVSELVV